MVPSVLGCGCRGRPLQGRNSGAAGKRPRAIQTTGETPAVRSTCKYWLHLAARVCIITRTYSRLTRVRLQPNPDGEHHASASLFP